MGKAPEVLSFRQMPVHASTLGKKREPTGAKGGRENAVVPALTQPPPFTSYENSNGAGTCKGRVTARGGVTAI